jgi:hypothetical protein
MKNLFFVFVFVFAIQTTVFSQDKINIDDLIGYWKPDSESTQLFFWKDVNGELQMQEISTTSGSPLDLLSLQVNLDSIIVKTIFLECNWVTESTYTFIDSNTLECIITGDGTGTVVYKKVK